MGYVMGIEMAVFAAVNMASSYVKGREQQKQAYRQAELYNRQAEQYNRQAEQHNRQARMIAQQTKGVAEEGAIKAAERAKRAKILGAKQKASFLNAGVTLQGTPQSIIADTYKTGLEDIELIKKNYDQRNANIMTQAKMAQEEGMMAVERGQMAGARGLAAAAGGRSAFIGSMVDGLSSVGTMAVMSGGFGVENMGGGISDFNPATMPPPRKPIFP